MKSNSSQANSNKNKIEFLTNEIQNIKQYLSKIKKNLDNNDKKNPDISEQSKFLDKIKTPFFEKMNKHFEITSKIFDEFNKEDYIRYQEYYLRQVFDLLYFPEINKHIYNKPFGYPGDYAIMNYILDYQDDYLGNSSYEKLINHYSCKLPFCQSNVVRKEYFKRKILEESNKCENTKISSVACGSIREFLDLRDFNLNIGQFNCIDFEPKVFAFIQEELKKKNFKSDISIKFILKNIIEISKSGLINEIIKPQNFIYFSGIFDYLPDRLAQKVIMEFVRVLADGGRMIICNSSKKNKRLHSYYEVLGKWIMIYRDEEDLKKLLKNTALKNYSFEYPEENGSYNYLVLSK